MMQRLWSGVQRTLYRGSEHVNQRRALIKGHIKEFGGMVK